MKKFLKILLAVAVIALNTTAFLHGNQNEPVQGKPVVAKPLRMQLNEVPFVLLPNVVKA